MVKVSHLTKCFGGVRAVDDLSLEVREGEIFTLLGPSGCGKTTTLRSIAGLESPDQGAILIGDRTVVSVEDGLFVPSHKRNIGMVFQSYAIWPHMSVSENVSYPLKVRHTASNRIREQVTRTLNLVGLEGFENRPATQLSGGQQQRVALARALVHEPSLLLLDEPFSNLDAKLREQMRIQLKVLLKKLTITVVFVTHDQVEALSLSDRIAVMQGGHVEQLGSPREIYENPATSFVRDFLGRTVLLEGKVATAEGGHVSIQLQASSTSTSRVFTALRLDLSSGNKVLVAMRPEDISLLNPDGDVVDSAWLPGTVETQLFIGDRCECCVRLESGETILFFTPRSVVLREGESVRLKMPEDGISLWRL